MELKPDYSMVFINLVEIYIITERYNEAEEKLIQLGLIEKEGTDEVAEYYLKLIIDLIHNRDTTANEEKIDELLKSNSVLSKPVFSYSFNEIEDWLKTSNLPDTKKDKIKALTEKLKKYC